MSTATISVPSGIRAKRAGFLSEVMAVATPRYAPFHGTWKA